MKINLSSAWMIGGEAHTAAAGSLRLASQARVDRGVGPADYESSRDPRCCPTVVDGVAVMPVQGGYLYHGRDYWMDIFGGLSYQALADEVERLAADATIKAVVFDVNCPGGSVDGVREFVDAVKKLAASKPTMAVAHDMATSGAYWPFAVCDSIVVTPTGRVGSVGGVSVIDDTTGMFEILGVKRTSLATGKLKAPGMPGVEVTKDQIENRRAQLDEPVAMFVADVAAGRGMSVEAVNALEAGTYPAMDAVRRGLADSVEPARDAITRFVAQYGTTAAGVTAVPAPAAQSDGNEPADAPDAKSDDGDVRAGLSPGHNGRSAQELIMDLKSLTVDQLRAANPDLVKEIAGGKPASIADLRGAFPKDAEFRETCIEGGLSLVAAKAAYADKLAPQVAALQGERDAAKAEVTTLTSKVASLEADLKAAKREARGTDPIGTDYAGDDKVAAGGKGKDGGDYLGMVAAKKEDLMLKDNLAPAQAGAMAHQIVQRAKPALYAEYKKSIGYGVNAAKMAK